MKAQIQAELNGGINKNFDLSLFITSSTFAKQKITISNNQFKWKANLLAPNTLLFIEIRNNRNNISVEIEIISNPSSKIDLTINNFDSIRFGAGFTLTGLPYQRETELFNREIIPLEQEYYASLGKVMLAKQKRKNNAGNLDSVINVAQLAKRTYLNELLKFISINRTSYFSLNKFRKNILSTLNISKFKIAELIKVANSFDSKLKVTDLWVECKRILDKKESLLIGNLAPDFNFLDMLNGKYQLSGLLKEKEVLICFTASWCGPCNRIKPYIEAIVKKYNITMVYISIDENKAAWLHAVKKNNYSGFLTCDLPEYVDSVSLKSLYNVDTIPKIYLIGKNGLIIYTNGNDETAQLDLLNRILQETKNSSK
jgi:thiol-disulfide isomerase/thioredoxin